MAADGVQPKSIGRGRGRGRGRTMTKGWLNDFTPNPPPIAVDEICKL